MEYKIEDFKSIDYKYLRKNVSRTILVEYDKLKVGSEVMFMEMNFDEINSFYVQVWILQSFVRDVKKNKITDEAGNILDLVGITPYFKSFSDGFYNGYFNLESKIEKEISNIFQNIERRDIVKAKKIFAIATTFNRGFPMFQNAETFESDKFYIKNDSFYNKGIEQGEFYKAWYIILNNSDFFEQFINEIEPKEPDKLGKKNLFNSMDLTAIETYFAVLKTENNKDNEKYLTPDKFDQFINKAFCNADLKPVTLNLGTKENQTIYDLFYSYFKYCINDYTIEPTQQCKSKYVKLLSDNFTNFTFKQVNDNFEKRPVKRLLKTLPKL